MAVSTAQKKASAKWDAAHMATLGVKLKKEQAEKFRVICAADGLTVSTALREYVLSRLREQMAEPMAETPPGGAILSPDVLRRAQDGANAAGEELPVFVERAVTAQIQRDKLKRQFDGESDDPEKALARLRERFAEKEGGATNEQPGNGD